MVFQWGARSQPSWEDRYTALNNRLKVLNCSKCTKCSIWMFEQYWKYIFCQRHIKYIQLCLLWVRRKWRPKESGVSQNCCPVQQTDPIQNNIETSVLQKPLCDNLSNAMFVIKYLDRYWSRLLKKSSWFSFKWVW